MKSKKWYFSKTFIVNLVAIFIFIAQSVFGEAVDPKTQGLILAAINMAVRLFTGKPIEGLGEKLSGVKTAGKE